MAPLLHQLTDHIWTIDLQFQGRAEVIASYLVYDGASAAIIEPGPASTLDALLESVQATGASLESVRQIFLTHIHLDHAGAAGVLAKQLPWVTVYVHPIGAPHVADPSKLVASAQRVYGDKMDSLWGSVLPVPSPNLVIVNDGDTLAIPGSTLRVFDTPGHARHHHAYLDERSQLLFAGDIAGVRMPGVRYVRPPTTPPELDIETWRASIARLRALNVSGLCLAHFGLFRGNLNWHWNDLETRLVAWANVIRAAMLDDADETEMVKRLTASATQEMQAVGADVDAYNVASSYEGIVQGLVRYWNKKNANAGK
ncbi:MAG: MBL fold metallo-hydrolase [Chloroflexi bacterium]|nr:MBL fold metallo-hydrolase [Chloroflexota bacterium]